VVALLGGAGMMQMGSWPLNYGLQAAEMDGLRAENRTDPNGIVHRFAAGTGGNRPVMILNDEYLPGGRLDLQLGVRRGPGTVPAGTALAYVRLEATGGGLMCDGWLTVEQVAVADAWVQFTMPCKLERDGLMSLSVWNLGTLDLSFRDVVLRWDGS
jgi:hypothetical protein